MIPEFDPNKNDPLDERDDAYVFVGRETELAQLQSRFRKTAEQGRTGAGIVLIFGAQGTGKTELMKQFAADLLRKKAAIHIDMPIESLATPVTPKNLRRYLGMTLGQLTDSIREGTKIGIPGFFEKDFSADTKTFVDIEEALDDYDGGKAILITLDEIQNLRAQDAAVLRKLQTHKGRVMVVCAGLQHSRAVLSKHGISRRALDLRTKNLAIESCAEAITTAVQSFGLVLDASTDPQFVHELATATCGFPPHLQSTISVIHQLLREGREPLEEPDAVRALTKAKREAFYERRLADMELRHAREILAQIAHRTKQSEEFMPVAAARRVIGSAHQVLVGEPYSGIAGVDEFVEQGCLEEDGSRVRILVPSMWAWLRSLEPKLNLPCNH